MNCCDMTASMLRHKLTIQREVLTQDNLGGDARTWVDIGKTFGHVKQTGGGERVFGQQLEANITHKITIRYRVNIQAKDRIVLRGVPLQVRNILNLEMRNQWLELSCESGVAT